MAPPTLPVVVPRSERFGDLVVAAVDRLEPRWGERLGAVDVEIREAPVITRGVTEVPLAGYRRPRAGGPATLVVYRRPVELRAVEYADRIDLIRDLVAEQLAELLGTTPGALDPAYDDRAGD